MNYLDLPIFEIHRALVNGLVTPLELVEESLKRAKEDSNNCFEYICEKEAIFAAKHLDLSKQNNLLWGIPYCLKDNIATKDIPTCASSDILKDFIPCYSATVYEKLQEQGAILIGKNTMDELAMGGTGTSGHLGKTFNPHDSSHTRLVGGSSCGSVACVSANIVPFSIGTDTGDSVRKPASYAGIIGLKPTWGRISRFGVFAFANSLDHVGIFARNLNDVEIVLNAIEGFDPKDLTSAKIEKNESCKTNYKIAVIKEIVDSCSEEAKKAFIKNVEMIKNKGIDISYVSMNINILKIVYPTYMVISCSEACNNYACLDGIRYSQKNVDLPYKEAVIKNRSDSFSNSIKGRFLIGTYSTDSSNLDEMYNKATKIRRLIVEEYKKIFNEFNAIYVPSANNVAPLFETKLDRHSDEFLIAGNHLAIQNFGGFPSITLPICDIDGLPFGGNLTTNLFEESDLLKISELIKND